MTKKTRRKFSAEFKATVALEAIKNQKTLAQLSQQYQVNPITIAKWKADMIEHAADVFRGAHSKEDSASTVVTDKLYAQISQLKVENDFLKKSARKLVINDSDWK